MSSYDHQMERQFSTQTLSSRGGSEMGSRYMVQSGFYMTSFTATIFIASLVTVAVLLITLLIALTVMLQSCQSKNSGIVESWKENDYYTYCKSFSLHSELNRLGPDSLPASCKAAAIRYIKGGEYTRDLSTTMWLVENYFSGIIPQDDGLDMVLMDVDDFFSLNSQYAEPLQLRLDQYGCSDCFEEVLHLKRMFILRMYMKLQAAGWPLVLISREPERQRNVTTKNLISAGHANWSSLILRVDDEMQMDTFEYFSRRRTQLEKEGFRIMAVFSSQMDALSGPCLGKRIFKLPNPIHYNVQQHVKSTELLKQNLVGEDYQNISSL